MAANEQLVAYHAWDAPTRWFHWINALSVLGLMLVGILSLFSGSLGISAAGRVTVKTIHVWLGYVMTLNLMWRFVWAFLGNRYARWRAVLPGGSGFPRALEVYVTAFLAGDPRHYLGHNPAGRVAVAIILLPCCAGGDRARAGRDRYIISTVRKLDRPLDRGPEC